tara:strand:- start:62 stop:538 length:477 start_codon:yes stop_codon:yes gene_type:complete
MAAAPTSTVSIKSDVNTAIDITSDEKKDMLLRKREARKKRKRSRDAKKKAKLDPLNGKTIVEFIEELSYDEPITAFIIDLFYYFYNHKTTFKKGEKDKLAYCKNIVKKEILSPTRISRSLSTYDNIIKDDTEIHELKYMEKAINKIILIRENRDDLFN